MNPVKVIISTESLNSPLTGIGRYTKYLVTGLMDHRRISAIYCFNGFRLVNPHAYANSTIYPRWKTKIRVAKEIVRQAPFAYQMYSAYRNRIFRVVTDSIKGAVYHEPGYILKPYHGPSIAAIHDLSHIHYAQYHPKERVKFLDRNLPLTLSRAAHIITGSEYVRSEIINILGVAPERVTVVYHGVDVAQFHPRGRDVLNPVLSRYGLTNLRYLLAVGTLEPRKNLVSLVEAYSRLPLLLQNEHPLIVVGAKGWQNYHSRIQGTIDKLERGGHIRCIGYIPFDDLPYIYAGAHGFAFPSFYEGFGLPPLEAMASGIPVVVSDSSSLPEVVGDVGIYVDPHNVDAIANGLERLLTDNVFRAVAGAAGCARAAQFSWERCCEKTINVYAEAGNAA